MSFLTVKHKNVKGSGKKDDNGKEQSGVVFYPAFNVGRSDDLFVRGGEFSAIWDDEKETWHSDIFAVMDIVDRKVKKTMNEYTLVPAERKFMEYLYDTDNGHWSKFDTYLRKHPDNYRFLNRNITYLDDVVTKEDYSSIRVPYNLSQATPEAYIELATTLYDPEELEKIEWSIGAILTGYSKTLQKFLVLYGKTGSGKSSMIHIIEKIVEGYYKPFDAKSMGSANSNFALEMLADNPLVAIQHDGDLSKIQDNTLINSITSHETIVINQKHIRQYGMAIDTFLLLGTNSPVKITDSKSGLIRRLIDVSPSDRLVPITRYEVLMAKINFEIGAIANRCINKFNELGPHYYNTYRPISMMFKTDVFFNFVEEHAMTFAKEEFIQLSHAYDLYKNYCNNSDIQHKLPSHTFREELKNYFDEYLDRTTILGQRVRSVFRGFQQDKLYLTRAEKNGDDIHGHSDKIIFDQQESILDKYASDRPAQYANDKGLPSKKWDDVTTTLADIDTSKLHWVKPILHHIVIDFDMKGPDGEKNLEKNIEAASKFPSTYAEISKGGNGVHLHYYYEGDVTKLAPLYAKDIEIKVYSGKQSLRRKLTLCNNVGIATISDGLPIMEKVISEKTIQDAKHLRALIAKALRREINGGNTRPSIDFINKIINDYDASGELYDVRDMKNAIFSMALESTNHAEYCMEVANKIKYCNIDDDTQVAVNPSNTRSDVEKPYGFFDLEVFPNLFLMVLKDGSNGEYFTLFNPSVEDLQHLVNKYRLIGFNNRKYDNHILYAWLLGYTPEQTYQKSKQIIEGNDKNAYFMEAWNLSYVDVYNYTTKKQSLKKWEVMLNIHHDELEHDWNKPLPESEWARAGEYCKNDVDATEAVFNATQNEFQARLMISAISGKPVNASNPKHVEALVYGKERDIMSHLVYTDLREQFPGYVFDMGKSTYKGVVTGEGGYVYVKTGYYENVGLWDVVSMHPTSMDQLQMFGKYTQNFTDILLARVAVKTGQLEKLKTLYGGRLYPFATAPGVDLKLLSDALKIVINTVYGYSSAKFNNVFRHPDNHDNIAAKRGALFMVDLLEACTDKGWEVIHIKTDSIKIANATDEMTEFINEFGKKYGYSFDYEAHYDKFAIVNKAVYIAHTSGERSKGERYWTATGAQFAHPYVFKTMFSGEMLELEDLAEIKETAKGTIYTTSASPEMINQYRHLTKSELIQALDAQFVGRVGKFFPVKPGLGVHLLSISKTDVEKDGVMVPSSVGYVTGTSEFEWLPRETVLELLDGVDNWFEILDIRYYNQLVYQATKAISDYTDPYAFMATPEVDTTEQVSEIFNTANPYIYIETETENKGDNEQYE